MASAIAMMVGGALVNALAFSGSNYLFSKLGKEEHQHEMERHNLATEQLMRERDAWNERRQKRLDFINEQLHKQSHSIKTFQDVDLAMKEYSIRFGKSLPSLGSEPVLDDFYVKSQTQNTKEVIFVTLGMLALIGGAVIYKRNYKK